MVELPAGMVDGSTFVGTAAKEIKEELGLEIPQDELINLTELAIPDLEGEEMPKAMFPSSGGCDECIPLFLHEKKVPRSTLKEWTGRLTGLRDEGEKITLKLVRVEDLWFEGARDAKALGALALWEGLKRSGKL
jgi:8-oxo-dGTP pyrophosphatase MutT (NUDIX family)